MVESTQKPEPGFKETYKPAFWFGTGASVVSLIVIIAFVRIGKAKSDLTADEKGHAHQIGDWELTDSPQIHFIASTAVQRTNLSWLQIRGNGGAVLLQLRLS